MDAPDIKIIGEYIIDKRKKIGQGGYSEVYLCEKNSKKLAAKIMEISPDEYKEEAIMREIKALSNLSGPNIVAMVEYLKSQNNHYFIMELCEGSLYKLMNQTGLTEQKVVDCLVQIVDGYKILYSAGIIHRDIKPSNILRIGSTLKLADFGTCKFQEKKEPSLHSQRPMTIQYSAPEVLKNQPCTYKIDIWSIGLVVYELLHKTFPWKTSRDIPKMYEYIKTTPLVMKEQISQKTKDFIKKCLEFDPNKRLTYEEMINHPIFNNSKINVQPIELAYAQQIMEQLVKNAYQNEKTIKDVKKILRGLSLQSTFMTPDEFKKLLKLIQPDIDQSRQKTILDFYKTGDQLIEIEKIESLFRD